MNTLLKQQDQECLASKTHNVTYHAIVEHVNTIMDRGITRIRRNSVADQLIKTVIGYASIMSEFNPVDKVTVFDTVACRISVTFQGKDKFEIVFENKSTTKNKVTAKNLQTHF